VDIARPTRLRFVELATRNDLSEGIEVSGDDSSSTRPISDTVKCKMTPSEYRQIRESLGLTQGQLADLLGVALNTVSRRELGQIAIEREAELALRWVAAKHKKNPKKSLKKA